MMENETLDALLARFDRLSLGPEAQWEIGVCAERLAESLDNRDALYGVRLRLVYLARLFSDHEGALTRFLWCAAAHDADPALFPARPLPHIPHVDLLWAYKWLVPMLLDWPHYSLEQVRDALDMMRAAYAREGAGSGGIVWAELHLLLEAGTDAEIAEALARVRATATDEYSHCDACAQASEIQIRQRLGQDDLALRHFTNLLARNDLCEKEPETITSTMLVPLLQAGHVEQARDLQARAYPRLMWAPEDLPSQAEHMLFFLATGNPASAYRLLVRHLPGLWHEGLSPASRLESLTLLLRVGTLIAGTGHGHLPLAGTDDPAARRVLGLPAAPSTDDYHDHPVLTVTQFLTAAEAQARTLAAQFDARNGSTRATGAVERALAAEPHEVVCLDLGGMTFPEDDAASQRYLVSGSKACGATADEWIELAHELEYMADVSDGGAALTKALQTASTLDQHVQIYTLLLKDPSIEPFGPILDRMIDQLEDSPYVAGYVQKLRTYSWTLWRRMEPSDGPPRESIPALDFAAEMRSASYLLWRLRLAGLLLRPVGRALMEQFEVWEESEDPAADDEIAAWNDETLRLLEKAICTPEANVYEACSNVHERVCGYLERGDDPPWGLLLAHVILHARSMHSPVLVVEVVRRAMNELGAPPPPHPAILRVLDYQAARARALDAPTLELAAFWAKSTIALYAGEGRDQREDRRITEIAQKLLHPLLAARMHLDVAFCEQSDERSDRCVDALRRALAILDATTHLRPLMTVSEREFLTRSTVLERLVQAELETGQGPEAFGHAVEAIAELREERESLGADARLATMLTTVCDLAAEHGLGDPSIVAGWIDEAVGLRRSERRRCLLGTEERDEATVELARALVIRAILSDAAMDDDEDVAASASEAIDLLHEVHAEWPWESEKLYARIIERLGDRHPSVAQRAQRALDDVRASGSTDEPLEPYGRPRA